MIPSSLEITNLHAELCSAISDPTRILVLYALADQPRIVSQLVEVLTLPQSTVSRHLAILRGAGLVQTARSGRQVVYALTDARVIQALDLMRAVLADRLSKHADLLTVSSME
jgi:DNA-binding transcriptional ArsR family regulator